MRAVGRKVGAVYCLEPCGNARRHRQRRWHDTRFATASDDGTACVWHVADIERFVIQAGHLDIQDLLAAACERAARNMSQEERRQYVGDQPYRETCPGKPVPGVDAGD